MKWLKALLVVCVLSLAQVIGVGKAQAASVFDDFFPAQATSTLINHIENYFGKSCGSEWDDYAATWQEAMHINNWYGPNPVHTAAMSAFDAAMANGGGVWVQYDQVNNGDNTSSSYFVTIYWAEDASQWQQTFTDSGGHQVFWLERKPGVPSSVMLEQEVIGSTKLVQGIGDCEVEWLWGGANQTVGYTGLVKGGASKLFLSTFDVIYPPGYEGGAVPSVYTPPVTTLRSGTVDCGGEDPQYMSIYQVGNNGAATLVPESLGRAVWSYSMTDGPYSITVSCGGTLATAYGAITPATGTDWVCDVYGEEPHYCVLG